MFGREIYKEILKEYDELSNKARYMLEDKKEVVYKKCNRIKEIDEELNTTCIKISKLIIGALKDDKKIHLEEIRDLTEKLKSEKYKLMVENGFSPTYFKEIYSCAKCEDTGFIKNEKCECFKQKLINKAYEMSNLSHIIKTENFTNFNLDYYSKEVDRENKMSPYENMSIIMRKSSIFIEEFNEKYRNLMFYGGAGVGKTFICSCIAKEILDKGRTVVYLTAFDLFDIFEKEKFSKADDLVRKDIIGFINDVDLLIIDDLGTEFITILSTTEFFNIVNRRILNKKSTIISTNLEPEKLMEQYSSRIISRLYGEYEIIKIFGKDIRILKKFKNKA